jgi:hypothetical protein
MRRAGRGLNVVGGSGGSCAALTFSGSPRALAIRLSQLQSDCLGFGAESVRGQSGTITSVVNALARAGVDLGDSGSVIPRPKGKRL